MAVCSPVVFESRALANRARRRVTREYRTKSVSSLCEVCDKYHFTTNVPEFKEVKIKILTLIGQGFRDSEIGPIIGLSSKGIHYHVQEMMTRLDAGSRSHLVAISVSLGIINPNEFVPALEEKKHG